MRLINCGIFARTQRPIGKNMNFRTLGFPPLKTATFSLLILYLLGWTAAATAETNVRASVDRSHISSEETFILSLVADTILFTGEPDVSALEKDFHVISRQQSSRTNIINGKVNSSRQWDYTLAPKREGNLTIPAIPMGKYQTRALTITVDKASNQSRGSNGDSVYLESDVTPRTAYVQAELQYTVKIFTSINFLDASLEAPEVDDAVVEATGEQRYQTLVDGRYYQVIERRYSIYPQTSGELTIPALTLQARVEGYRPSMLDPGRLVVKRSQEHRLRIQPPPAEFKGAVWLPAKELVLTESWSNDLDDIQIGDSITRTVNVQAVGLLGSQLPALPSYKLDNAKIYPDQAKIEKADEQSKWSGIRSESMAIIPTKAGEFILPEVRIPWWNTVTNKAEVAILPERRFTVSAPPLIGASTPLTETTQNATLPLAAESSTQSAMADYAPTSPLLWIIISALSLSNIGFAAAWYRARKTETPSKATTPHSGSEATAFSKLKKCIQTGGDASSLRAALIHWGQCYYQRPLSLSQLAMCADELRVYCHALDAQLFGGHSDVIDTKALLDAVKKCRANANVKITSPALSPLYPS